MHSLHTTSQYSTDCIGNHTFRSCIPACDVHFPSTPSTRLKGALSVAMCDSLTIRIQSPIYGFVCVIGFTGRRRLLIDLNHCKIQLLESTSSPFECSMSQWSREESRDSCASTQRGEDLTFDSTGSIETFDNPHGKTIPQGFLSLQRGGFR